MHAFLVHRANLSAQQRRNLSAPEARMLLGQPMHAPSHRPVLLRLAGEIPLGQSRLPNAEARVTLTHAERRLNVTNLRALPGRAQYFPSTTSYRIALSNERSATSFFGRAFSFFRSLSSLS